VPAAKAQQTLLHHGLIAPCDAYSCTVQNARKAQEGDQHAMNDGIVEGEKAAAPLG
jgi:hypothetical protein